MKSKTPFYSLLDLFLREGRSICTDTRKLMSGDIFIGLRGEHFDGNAYAENALEAGAAYVIIDRAEYYKPEDDRYILVAHTLDTLQQLATAYRNTFQIPIIGLTGSNGKTTTKELIHSVLATELNSYATSGNYNNHIGVPLTLLAMPCDAKIAIIEMGANQPGDIAELAKMVQPTHGIITNIAEAHLEKLIDLEGVKRTKGALYDFLRVYRGYAFVNCDDKRVVELAHGIPQMGYSVQEFEEGHQLTIHKAKAKILAYHLEGMEILIQHPDWEVAQLFETSLSGIHNVHNILVAVSVGVHFGISIEGIKKGIQIYRATNQRSQLMEIGHQRIWMDAYNANPASMKAAVDHVFAVESKKTALVLGDMFELGPLSHTEHKALGEYLNQYDPYVVVGIGEEMKYAIEAFEGKKCWYADVAEAREAFRSQVREADLILLKGSRAVGLELLLEEVNNEMA